VKKLRDTSVTFIAGTLGRGGAERQLYYNLSALAACGATARVLSLTSGEFWENRIRALGVEVIWVGQSGHRLVRLRSIVHLLRQQKPDFVQSQHFFANLYAAMAGRLTGIHDIGAIRSSGHDEVIEHGPVFGPASLKLPRALVVNSQAAVENVLRRNVPPERVYLLPNVVDTDEFAPPAERRNSGPLHILTVGRLVPVKRQDLLVRAAASLRQKLGRVVVTIAGPGPLEPELRRLGDELGFGSDLRLPGALDGAALVDAYQNADLFVLTSEFEGTPNALMEAMAAALPVVATDVGGIPALVKHDRTGLLVPPGSDELVASLEQLAGDTARQRELGSAARKHIVEHHSVRMLPHALEEIYNAIA
jgi:glycosyltransferase involved in cell wall biosynthesis